MVQESLFSFLFLRKNIDQRGKRICKTETILWSCICFLLCLGSWHTWENAWFHLWYDLGLEHAEDICSRPKRFNRYCSTNDTVEIWLLTELQLLLWQLSAIKVTKERISRRKRSMRPGVQPDWTGMCYLEHGADEISRLHRLLFMIVSCVLSISLLRFVNEDWLTQKIATPII